MKSKISLFCVTTLLLLTACGSPGSGEVIVKDPPLPINKFDEPVVRQIYDLADRRSMDSLLPYLDYSMARIRKEAALVFGSVQAPEAGPRLEELLEDGDPEVVAAAAWAIGQIGDSSYAGHLLDAMTHQSGETQVMIGEALGKAGTKAQVEAAIAAADAQTLPATAHNAVMQAVYRAGLRKRVPASAQAFALKVLAGNDAQAQLYAGAFLGRVAESGTIADPEKILAPLRIIQDADVRQQLVKALVRCPDSACARQLKAVVADPKESPSTRANAFRAAGSVHVLDAEAQQAVHDASDQVAVAAAEYLDQHGQGKFAEVLGLAKTVKAWRPRAILLKHAMTLANAQHAAEGLKAITQCIDSLMPGAGIYEQGALYAALGQDPAQHPRLIEVAEKNAPVVATYAMEAYLGFYPTSGPNDRAVLKNIQNVMRKGDPGLVAMGAEHIANAPIGFLSKITRTEFLDSALKKLHLPEDIEAYNAVLKAMAKVDGEEYKPHVLGFQNPIDWKLVQRIPTGQTAVISTNRGKVVIRLNVEDAPGTVANFVRLARAKFYDGKHLHRVVPAFVAQGGCPRGDGWGSSPESIRSEWAPLHYSPGAIGMASAGKDTESCQWFITHCSVPHLDGRYTIFGYVTEGMAVVQEWQIGDEIVSVSFPGLDV